MGIKRATRSFGPWLPISNTNHGAETPLPLWR